MQTGTFTSVCICIYGEQSRSKNVNIHFLIFFLKLLSEEPYALLKAQSTEYKRAKAIFLASPSFISWQRKPIEQEQFKL